MACEPASLPRDVDGVGILVCSALATSPLTPRCRLRGSSTATTKVTATAIAAVLSTPSEGDAEAHRRLRRVKETLQASDEGDGEENMEGHGSEKSLVLKKRREVNPGSTPRSTRQGNGEEEVQAANLLKVRATNTPFPSLIGRAMTVGFAGGRHTASESRRSLSHRARRRCQQ